MRERFGGGRATREMTWQRACGETSADKALSLAGRKCSEIIEENTLAPNEYRCYTGGQNANKVRASESHVIEKYVVVHSGVPRRDPPRVTALCVLI